MTSAHPNRAPHSLASSAPAKGAAEYQRVEILIRVAIVTALLGLAFISAQPA